MTDEQSREFAQTLAVLASTYNEPLSEARVEAYWLALRHIALDDLRDASLRAMRTLKFFPRPSELIELAHGVRDDDIEAAWMEWRRQARAVGGYGSPVLSKALVDTLGAVFVGWEQACWSDFTDEMWAAKRKEFGRVYAVMCARSAGTALVPTKAVGFIERTNAEAAAKRQLPE